METVIKEKDTPGYRCMTCINLVPYVVDEYTLTLQCRNYGFMEVEPNWSCDNYGRASPKRISDNIETIGRQLGTFKELEGDE